VALAFRSRLDQRRRAPPFSWDLDPVANRAALRWPRSGPAASMGARWYGPDAVADDGLRRTRSSSHRSADRDEARGSAALPLPKRARLRGHRTNTDRAKWRLPYPFEDEGGAFLLGTRTVVWPDPPGLFVVRCKRRAGAAAPVGRRLVRPRGPARHSNAEDGRLRRYCSGCSRETEHTTRASGATSCQTCGQRRAAAVQPRLSTWSSWPRNPGEPHGSRRP
jgi:hypothetical protein